MKKTRVKSVLAIMLAAAMLIGCGAKGGESASENTSKPDEKQEELKKMVDEAFRLYGEEKRWYDETTDTVYYEDGTEEASGIISTNVDKEKQIVEWSVTEEEGKSMNFYQKDGEDTWVYWAGFEGEFIRYKETPKEKETTYDRYVTVRSPFDSDGYDRVEFEDAGEEKYEDKDAVKVKVTAYPAKTDEDTEISTTSREEVIEELGLTEESIAAVEGLSELLDKYVEEKNYFFASDYYYEKVEYTYWIDKKSNQLLYVEGVAYPDAEVEAKCVEYYNVQDEFSDKSLEASMIVENMNYGWSLEEAKATAKENMDYLEAEDTSEEFVHKITEKVISKTKFIYGDKCPAQTPLPTDYKEITEEQYMNGEY